MAVSLDSGLDADTIKRMSTRGSSILPSFEDARNVVAIFTMFFASILL